MSTRLLGRAAAPGAAAGPAFVVEAVDASADAVPETRSGSSEEEIARLDAALGRAAAELRELAAKIASEAGEDEADIFESHADFAADPELASQAHAAIRSGASAERAVTQAFATFRALLEASESEYRAARVTDLDDVSNRIVAILLGRDTAVRPPSEVSVIVARELTPSQTAGIPRELIAAVVTETGSPTSHAAILARSLGIPAVVACDGLLATIRDGVEIAVDGRTGAVIVDPTEDELHEIEERAREEGKRRAELTALRDEVGRTADGRRVELAANIGSPEDLPAALDAGAEGSGLIRTEFLFLGRRTAPSIEEQVLYYTEVLRAFPERRVVFRTMDVGADKPLQFVPQEPEENPALGLRGIRLSLLRRNLLEDQLRALVRAARDAGDAGRMAVMFPMVSTARELVSAREVLTDAAAAEGIGLEGVEVGVMIEVPSAALAARRLAAHADFLSIGTNDLLQYLFAADRLNGSVAELAEVCEPDVLALIGDVIEAGHDGDAWVGVCGEAASDVTVAAALVGLGADELSMTRVAIPEVKDALRNLAYEDCRAAVRRAIAEAPAGAEARRMIEEQLDLPQ